MTVLDERIEAVRREWEDLSNEQREEQMRAAEEDIAIRAEAITMSAILAKQTGSGWPHVISRKRFERLLQQAREGKAVPVNLSAGDRFEIENDARLSERYDNALYFERTQR